MVCEQSYIHNFNDVQEMLVVLTGNSHSYTTGREYRRE